MAIPTLVVTRQLQVERRTGKVRRPETDVLPLCHATNRTYLLTLIMILPRASAHLNPAPVFTSFLLRSRESQLRADFIVGNHPARLCASWRCYCNAAHVGIVRYVARHGLCDGDDADRPSYNSNSLREVADF